MVKYRIVEPAQTLQGKGQVPVDGWLLWNQFRSSAQERGSAVVMSQENSIA
jgi:hypothetical protein